LLYSLEEESAEQPAADEPSSTSPVDVQEQEEQEEEEQGPPAAFSELPVAESDGIDWKAVAQAEKAAADQAKADLAAAKAEHQLKVDQFKADTAEIQVQQFVCRKAVRLKRHTRVMLLAVNYHYLTYVCISRREWLQSSLQRMRSTTTRCADRTVTAWLLPATDLLHCTRAAAGYGAWHGGCPLRGGHAEVTGPV
jgi:hypothetical protein